MEAVFHKAIQSFRYAALIAAIFLSQSFVSESAYADCGAGSPSNCAVYNIDFRVGNKMMSCEVTFYGDVLADFACC